MIGRSQLDAIVAALTVVLPARLPADAVLKQFFRDHKSLGQKDRAIVADTVYAALRRRRLLEHLTPKGTPREMALAAIVKAQGIGISQVEASLSADEKTWLAALKAQKTDDLPLELRADLPDWVIEKLRKNHTDEEILAIGQSLQQPAPLDLRVNESKAPREPVLERLERDQIAARAMRYSPIGIRLRDKPALNQHVLFLEGVVEVQDEGSQILGMLLEARRGEMVVDFCAGAGGKTLQLGAAMGSSGRLYAFDVSEKRLANLGPRLKRSGLSNVFPQRISNENDAKVKRLRGKIDRVLVDAPCTGLGTLRRNPDLKWRQTAEGVVELNAKQTAILAAAGALVKPGGRLVYGTCSLLEEENEAVVTAFLAAHPEFGLIPCKDVLARKDIRIPGVEEYLRLLPNVHDTDGFFAAVMERGEVTAATDLENLFSAFASAQFARHALIEFAVLAIAFGLAWLIARSLRARLGERKIRWKFGEGGFNRVIFPLAALAFTWAAALVLARYAPVPFLNLAVKLLLAFTVIRAAVYVLRFVLPDGALLRGSERTIAWIMWVGVLLHVTGLLPEVTGALDSVSFDVAKQRISLLLVLQAAAAVAVTLAVSMWFARVIEGRVMANEAIQMSTRVVVSKFIHAIALFVAILIALPLVGLDLTALTVFGGALGVGLGFGLQKIASNYVSGYIILLDHSIRIGDLVTVDNRHGEVREIAARYTVVRSSDGTESIIPNETLITQSVTNYSYTDRKVAVKVVVSVGYESDIDAAMEVLLEAARAHPRVIAEPAPGVSLNRLAETGIELELTAWIDDPENGQGGLRSDILLAVLGRFRERGVVVPPPPREIRVLATPETQISGSGSRT